jgi:hypothetical protein
MERNKYLKFLLVIGRYAERKRDVGERKIFGLERTSASGMGV